MVEIKNVEIQRFGNSRVVVIPADYFKHSELEEGKLYNITLKEVQK